jgi:RNA polymerase sigma-70 factor (ECF subfamily)
MSDQDKRRAAADSPDEFATTHWSIVLAAGQDAHGGSDRALSTLCQTYWYPLYAYVRRRVGNPDEAQDLTQSFFAQLLERHVLAIADPQRGRFRAFLLTAMKNFLNNEWNKARTQKRGGRVARLSLDFDSVESRYGMEPSHDVTPEKLYERQWTLTLLDRVLDRLQAELAAKNRQRHFDVLRDFLTGDPASPDYSDAARQLGISPAAAKQAAYRMRKQYRQLLRAEVAETVADANDVEDEIRSLLDSLGR